MALTDYPGHARRACRFAGIRPHVARGLDEVGGSPDADSSESDLTGPDSSEPPNSSIGSSRTQERSGPRFRSSTVSRIRAPTIRKGITVAMPQRWPAASTITPYSQGPTNAVLLPAKA